MIRIKITIEKFSNLAIPWNEGIDKKIHETTFRILQYNDEHFYAIDLTGYHWPLHGFGLSDAVLKKIYKTNALKILRR